MHKHFNRCIFVTFVMCFVIKTVSLKNNAHLHNNYGFFHYHFFFSLLYQQVMLNNVRNKLHERCKKINYIESRVVFFSRLLSYYKEINANLLISLTFCFFAWNSSNLQIAIIYDTRKIKHEMLVFFKYSP